MQPSAVSHQLSASKRSTSGRPRPLILILALFLLSILSTLTSAQETPVALKGGKLLTVSHGVIENGVIVMQNGKITAVGAAGSVNIPANAQVIDATGETI